MYQWLYRFHVVGGCCSVHRGNSDLDRVYRNGLISRRPFFGQGLIGRLVSQNEQEACASRRPPVFYIHNPPRTWL
jgi:hypothetical protein